MVEDWETPPRDGFPITRTWTADDRSARSMARAALGVAQRKPAAWLTHACVILAFALLAVFSTVSAWVAALLAAGLVCGFVWTDYRRLLAGFRTMFPVGSELGIGVGRSGMTVQARDGTSHCAFSMFRRVRLLRGYVLLENQVRGIVHLYPRELFTNDDLLFIRAAVPS